MPTLQTDRVDGVKCHEALWEGGFAGGCKAVRRKENG